MAGGIPQEAVVASVLVLLYSSVSLTLCMLVVCLLISYGERFTFITILASFTALSTTASIIQQVYYAIHWEEIKQADYEKAIQSLTTPSIGLSGPAEEKESVLFIIQFYSYNVMSVSVLFWAFGLFVSAWQIGARRLGSWQSYVPFASKIFAIFWPCCIIGTSSITAVKDNTSLYFAVSNSTMIISLLGGSVLIALILYKYMKTRRIVTGYAHRGRWWASKDSRTNNSGTVESGVTITESQRSIYDRALVTRFTIGFVILAIFEAAAIAFSVFSAISSMSLAHSGKPDLSVHGAISEILFFIPGVTTSLVTYLVFGTAKPWKQYWDLVVGCCGLRRKIREHRRKPPSVGDNADGYEFERLATIPNQRSGKKPVKGRELHTLPTTVLDINKPLPVVRANTSPSGTPRYYRKGPANLPGRLDSNSNSMPGNSKSMSSNSMKRSNSIGISNRYNPDLVHNSQYVQPDKELGKGFNSEGIHHQNSHDFLSDSSD